MNKNIPYHDIIMKANYQDIYKLQLIELPSGYYYDMYQDGDEVSWANLELSVNEFDSYEDALDYFNRTFMPYKAELYKRMAFIKNKDNEIVATTTAWFKDSNTKHYPTLHWVSCSPSTQGLGLGKAIVIYALNLFKNVDSNQDIFLHTQTWSYKAIGLYLKLGFNITNEDLNGKYTDPKCIDVLKNVMNKDIFDLINYHD